MNGFRSLTDLGITPSYSGKVREMVDLGDRLLMVTTDRLSAFDCILPEPLPEKGQILNELSCFWLRGFEETLPTHYITAADAELPPEFARHKRNLSGRWVMVKKAERIPVECVVRGYLAGSGWGEYRRSGAIQGIELPPGLREFGQLPEPIFTPTTKEDSGHDQPIDFAELVARVGQETADQLRETSLALFRKASVFAKLKGLVLADTKFEFGRLNGALTLIDEVLTPDSSRYWTVTSYAENLVRGRAPECLDKQYVRDYLLTLNWDRNPPAPSLPPRVGAEAVRRYKLALTMLAGGARQPDWRLVK
ncbi:MAG: phosphoribosylaminoimidazolesuccinocarboxamide synthase [Candidatus Eisenbacteria bacterium]|nr:phosphoribosylaminoimidazolesuccinocarboxamide synthase [Candidatus Eisenbacteria bacterium]